MPDSLNLASLAADLDRLGLPKRQPPRDPLDFGMRVFTSDRLPAPIPRKLTRWERLRVWVEGLADRAEIYYHFPRVKRTRPEIAYLFGNDLYISPRSEAAIRAARLVV